MSHVQFQVLDVVTKEGKAYYRVFLVSDDNKRRFRHIPVEDMKKFTKPYEKNYSNLRSPRHGNFGVTLQIEHPDKLQAYLDEQFKTKAERALINLRK